MINATFTLKIQSINETHDGQGVKITYGECIFSHYSKDGIVEDSIAYRAKGAAALSIAEAQTSSNGVAIGYLDIEVKDSGKGYKNKSCTLVIRNFIPTTSANISSVSTTNDPILPVPQENTKQLVGAATASSANNGYLNTTDTSKIPF
ncbi:hypothetical protein G7B40_025070 [Aetokthonos hydrillicola Thurmond2011]|jgi:hypothetical protein|uniref:Uncharacterized protein n=1 Tax=Aetokthonos hydrillicola Thurmond2011 TaxID=2712845 RepID=A0AAP5IAT8_9CYAN|nr:hypothetical protein [Aetokthonos hydrillicola]MBO3458472.1 hypothetical protein [Aetokthonos hydrillicola CCALA 1050]MBW4586201.1 hypothetical protein [Aetokthonos hydrillicola CCALA 1050]MDR9897809.1 hypothetical protein [Aetokthonos hydrillicola Thurmond2011]